MLGDIRAGKIDAVAAWDQDRVNRMLEDFVAYKGLFIERGILLATSNNGEIDLSTPSGVLTAAIKTAVSEHEIAMMRIRQRRAAQQRAERGHPKWKKAFGYVPDIRRKEDDDGTRVIDVRAQQRVVAAYQAVLRGEKITYLANRWNAEKLFGLNGKPWSASTLSLFLRSPRNAGLREHNGQIVLDATGKPVKGTWPPLVEEDLWRGVQTVLNAPGRAPGPKSVRKHLLTGVMRCGREGCGGYLAGNWVMNPTGGQPGRPKAGETKVSGGQAAHSIAYSCRVCRRVSVRAEHVEPLLMNLLVEQLSRPGAAKFLRKKTFDRAEAEKLRTEEALLLAKQDQIADDYADDMLTGAQAARATARIQEKLDDIVARQQDQDRLRVLDGIPLGTDEVVHKIEALPPDRLRSVFDLLATITIQPVGKGGKVFNPDRVMVEWKT
ncbi:hypothetical protein BHQ20_28835 [Mycobacterium intermedium]|nr:hypothetical protein BHQ20_28835 [Mycobacterium intermedium]